MDAMYAFFLTGFPVRIRLIGIACWMVVGCFAAFQREAPKRFVIHATPAGSAIPDGSRSAPHDLEGALACLRELLRAKGLPDGGIGLVLHEGRYSIVEPIRLGEEFRGTARSPIVIRAAENETVVFDGAIVIDPTRFQAVTDPQEQARLASSAADRILVQTVTDPRVVTKLREESLLGLVVDGRTYLPARFPNHGYAKLAPETVSGEISPPAVPLGKEDYGVRAGHPPYQEAGREQGWFLEGAARSPSWLRRTS